LFRRRRRRHRVVVEDRSVAPVWPRWMAARHRSAGGRWWFWRSWSIQRLRGRPELRTQSRSGRLPSDVSTCIVSVLGELECWVTFSPRARRWLHCRLLMLSITGVGKWKWRYSIDHNTTCYQYASVTVAVFFIITEITRYIRQKSRVFWGGPRWNIAIMFGTAKTRMVWLYRTVKKSLVTCLAVSIINQYSFNYGMTECRPHIKYNKQNTKVHKYSVSKRNVTKRSVELELCRPSICFV